MDSNKKRYKEFFQKGGVHSNGLLFQKFSSMTYKRKKDYVSNTLLELLNDFPDDKHVAEFVAIGRQELAGSLPERLCDLLSQQKVNNYITCVFISFLLILLPSQYLYILPSQKRKIMTIEHTI